jgi:acyl-CoA reductase-like NAD-dependent aldehyde dehydrogenase
MGVVAAITPWNFPIVLACWKLGPALRAGNTVVLKPSPFTPLSTLAMGSVLAGALPPGVLNVVSGTDPLGEWMTSHPVPRKVSFTGSIATGKRVAAAAATDLKRVTLELGGNDPAIVLDDADPNAIADSLFSHAFANCGQVCIAIKRVYAPEAMVADLVESLADRARRTVVGDGMDEATELGPINNLPQLERVTNLVDDALAHGARAVAGGHRLDRPGYFFAPTIIDRAHDGLKVVDEEQFGPVLPVVAYRDVEDAVAAANGTNYGLCASVWSSDPDRAERVANRLECGTAWINTHLEVAPHQPFSGVKWSGIGVENGRRGLDEFCELQVIHRPQGPPLLDHRQS